METPERQINVPLLRKTLEHIEAHPQEWNQADWRCKTGMCFAGTAVHLLGGVWDSDPESGNAILDGKRDHCSNLAIVALDLSTEEQTRLFSANNTLDDLRIHVAALSGEPVPVPVWPVAP